MGEPSPFRDVSERWVEDVAASLARRYARGRPDLVDELTQVGRIAMWRAAQVWQEDRAVLEAWLATRARQRMIDALRGLDARRLSVHAPLSEKDAAELAADLWSAGSEEHAVALLDLDRGLQRIDGRRLRALVLVAEGATYAEAGAALGVSSSQAYRYVRAARVALGAPARPPEELEAQEPAALARGA